MKKTIFQLCLAFSLCFAATNLSAETRPEVQLETLTIEVSDNSCTLKVTTRHGSAAKSIKVSTDVSGGMSCVGGRSFYTDSDGYVTLNWSDGCKLKKIYIDGKGYDVDFKDGGSYSISM